MNRLTMLFWKIYGYLIYTPLRTFFWKMVCNTELRKTIEKNEFWGYTQYPNYHWYFLYKTVFKFFSKCNYDYWRPFCTWEDHWLSKKPWYARLIHWIGSYTAGAVISGGRCCHCGREAGCQVELSDSDKYFELVKTGTTSTQEGTDHWFQGVTTCPCCGFKSEYSDGSL